MSRFALKLAIAASLVFTGSDCLATEHRTRIDDDPSHELNWNLDLEHHKILDRETYRHKLQEMRVRLEADLASNPKPDANSYSGRRFELLKVYYGLGLTEEANALVKPTDGGIDQSSFILQNLHLRSNRAKLLEIRKRYYESHKNKTDFNFQCSELVAIADLNYQLGLMKEAEQKYKEAYLLALKTAEPPGKSRDTPGSVNIGAFYSYACFLADRNRIEESRVPIEQMLKYCEAGDVYSFSGNCDNFGAYLTLVKKKDTLLFSKVYTRCQKLIAKESTFGLIAKNGHEITEPRFFSHGAFSDGLAVAQDNLTRRFGYIDKTGAWKLQPKYTKANPFSRGTATAKLSESLLPIDTQGYSTSFSLIDSQGRVLKCLNAMYVSPFIGDLCCSSRSEYDRSQTTAYNLLDRSGDVLYSGRLGDLKKENEHLYSIYIPTYMTGNGGCVVTTGGYRITFTVEPDPLRKGHLKLVQKVNDSSVPKLLQEQPAYILNPQDKTNQEKNDVCSIVYDKNIAYLQNRAGKKISIDYDYLQRLNANCFRARNMAGRWGLLNSSGGVIVPFKYDEIRVMSDGMAAFLKDNKWGFVDARGQEVVPAKYDEVGDFQDGVAFYKRKP